MTTKEGLSGPTSVQVVSQQSKMALNEGIVVQIIRIAKQSDQMKLRVFLKTIKPGHCKCNW